MKHDSSDQIMTRALRCLAMMVAAGMLLGRPSFAATGCGVTVNETDGTIKVSANSTNSTLRWGIAAGQENTVFANAGTCISGSSANNCMLGTSGTLAANTPPAGCTIYLADNTASCSKWLPRCIPGVRLRDSSFAAGDPRIAAVSLEDGGTTLRFSGVNLQLVSGSGSTEGTVNGLGNLIVGYNESGSHGRGGSHNVVVGVENGYTGYAGLVTGEDNVVGNFSAVIAGYANSAVDYSAVTGGALNLATGTADLVGGGYGNQANGIGAVVSGGTGNYATAAGGWVGGGDGNYATANSSAVVGGLVNTASGYGATVAGGTYNEASGDYSAVLGGTENTASADYSTAVGGDTCTVTTAHQLQAGPDCLVIEQ